jgi:phosphoacetylglucosamine mutase
MNIVLSDITLGDVGPIPSSPLSMLATLSLLMNQTIGDAISNLLVIEFALAYFGYSLQDWIDYTYGPDLCSKQLKLYVRNKALIVSDKQDADRHLVSPKDVQIFIDDLLKTMQKTHNGAHFRAFVRPSGTEDVLRIYVEAPTDSLADSLAVSIARYIYDHHGGIGDRP